MPQPLPPLLAAETGSDYFTAPPAIAVPKSSATTRILGQDISDLIIGTELARIPI
ncbi:MAG: hypothetical protein F6J95_030680 [Leptolyngbya sp. SIO1E4]|nr:hypothetical protein [Leptolyngbya sp. SIO1E4]